MTYAWSKLGDKFQSTHPVRGATPANTYYNKVTLFQSTHPVRGATAYMELANDKAGISIHAPREGCDLCCPSKT